MGKLCLLIYLVLGLPVSAFGGSACDTGLDGKVIVGYQGWFRMPNDGTDAGYSHWSADKTQLTAKTAVFDIWPNMADYSSDERFEFKFDGVKVSLFSSVNPKTIERHFQWMQEFDIDGAEMQRFVKDLAATNRNLEVLKAADGAARKTSRCIYLGYDFTSTNEQEMLEKISSDWKFLSSSTSILKSPVYLRQETRPVIQVWGLFYPRISIETAEKVLAFLRHQKIAPIIVGGVTWDWRFHPNEWIAFYKKFDLLRPWNVGHHDQMDGVMKASTTTWSDDILILNQAKVGFIPTVYPGFQWNNLINNVHPPGLKLTVLPRRNGAFYWEQFVEIKKRGLHTAFVAMFDEVNEGTAIFKIDATPPSRIFFHETTVSPDLYLFLTKKGKELLSERKSSLAMPTRQVRQHLFD